MPKKKTNKKAGASHKRTESRLSDPQAPDPATTLPQNQSSANIPKAHKRTSTIPNHTLKEPTMPDITTTPLNPSSRNRTASRASGPQAPLPPPAPTHPTPSVPIATALNPTTTLDPAHRIQKQDRIASLKLSTKDMEAETLRLREILAEKKAELHERKKELMGRVKGNEFGRRWREVRRTRARGEGGVAD
jgi:hypothetical protein